jgi:hypothetical protein
LGLTEVKKTGEGRRVLTAQTPVQALRTAGSRKEQLLTQVHLKNVAGPDVIDGSRHGGQVTVAVEIARQAGQLRQFILRRELD